MSNVKAKTKIFVSMSKLNTYFLQMEQAAAKGLGFFV